MSHNNRVKPEDQEGPDRKEQRPNKKEQERQNRQENLYEYNSITQSVKPENENQRHNVREEGIGRINQKR